MAKYSSRSSRPMEPSQINRKIHPIWRGVGFVLMTLSPFLGYAAMLLFLDENARLGWIGIPTELLVSGPDPLIWVKILLTVVFMLIFYGVLTIISFIVFRIFAPPSYGPYDVPPVPYKGKQYKR